jgi:hypothetical protein
MRNVYERERRLLLSAQHVFRFGETTPKKRIENSYIESATAARLCRIFEDGEKPPW